MRQCRLTTVVCSLCRKTMCPPLSAGNLQQNHNKGSHWIIYSYFKRLKFKVLFSYIGRTFQIFHLCWDFLVNDLRIKNCVPLVIRTARLNVAFRWSQSAPALSLCPYLKRIHHRRDYPTSKFCGFYLTSWPKNRRF